MAFPFVALIKEAFYSTVNEANMNVIVPTSYIHQCTYINHRPFSYTAASREANSVYKQRQRAAWEHVLPFVQRNKLHMTRLKELRQNK